MNPERMDAGSGVSDNALRFQLSNAGGDPVRLAVTGELDQDNTDHLRRAVADVLQASAPATLQIDASGIGFLDSAGIRCLLMCRADARTAGAHLVLVDPAPCVQQVLEITGLLETFGLPVPATPTWQRDTPVRATARFHGPIDMQELLVQSAAVRREAQETRRRAEAMQGDGLLRRVRLDSPPASTTS